MGTPRRPHGHPTAPAWASHRDRMGTWASLRDSTGGSVPHPPWNCQIPPQMCQFREVLDTTETPPRIRPLVMED